MDFSVKTSAPARTRTACAIVPIYEGGRLGAAAQAFDQASGGNIRRLRSKGDFRGKSAVLAAKGAEEVNNVCLDIDHPDMVEGGEALMLDGRRVGTINSPCYSHRMGKSLALAHIRPGLSVGTTLKVSGDDLETTATISASPIYDPDKLRTMFS